MMDDEQTGTSSESVILYILGIGTEGCQGIRYIKEKGNNEGVTLVAIHTDAETLAKSGADINVLLELDKSMFDESGLPDKRTREYFVSNLGSAIKKGDAFLALLI
jgi:hypothetical protein